MSPLVLILHTVTHLRVPVGRICLVPSVTASGFFTGVKDLVDTGAAFWPFCIVSDRQGLWLKELRAKNTFQVKIKLPCLLFILWLENVFFSNLRPVFMLSSAVLMSLVLSFALCLSSAFSVLLICLSSSSCLRSQSASERTMVSWGSDEEEASPLLEVVTPEELEVNGLSVSSSILCSCCDETDSFLAAPPYFLHLFYLCTNAPPRGTSSPPLPPPSVPFPTPPSAFPAPVGTSPVTMATDRGNTAESS